MLTNEMVLKIFADYLAEDTDLEIVQTRHGLAVMLWDNAGQDWSDVTCCQTPEELFDKLLESAAWFCEYKILRKQKRETLDAEGEKQVEQVRQYYLQLKEEWT